MDVYWKSYICISEPYDPDFSSLLYLSILIIQDSKGFTVSQCQIRISQLYEILWPIFYQSSLYSLIIEIEVLFQDYSKCLVVFATLFWSSNKSPILY